MTNELDILIYNEIGRAYAEALAELAEEALLLLSEAERDVLDLRDNLGLEYAEMAEVLGLRTPEAAKLRVSRARRRWEERTRELLGSDG